jgi:hypothetical protein
MKCSQAVAWLFTTRAASPPPVAVRRHLKRCRKCCRRRRRLVRLEAEAARLPLPAANAAAKARFLDRVAQLPVPIRPAAPRRRWLPLLTATAAALLLGFALGVGLPRPGQPDPSRPPLLADKHLDERMLPRLIDLNLQLAQSSDPAKQLDVLAKMAGELRTEAIRLARSGAPDELPLLITLHDRLVRRGLVSRAQALPAADRPALLAPLAQALRGGQAEVEQATQQLPPALADLLRPLGVTAETGARQLSAAESLPAEPDPVPALAANLGTARDLVAFVVSQSLLLAEEDDPLQRAWHCNHLADQFSLALVMASSRGDRDRALTLGKHVGDIMDRGVTANLNQLQASGDPRLAELNQVIGRVRKLVATIDASLTPMPGGPASPAIPYEQVKSLEHTLKDLEKSLREIGKEPGKPADPKREIRGVVKSFSAEGRQLVLAVKEKGKDFDMTFHVPADVKLWGPGPKQRSLSDLVPNARVRVVPREGNTIGELRVD